MGFASGQFVARYAALYLFFLEGLESAANRLTAFVEKAALASLYGDVFDDAATGQGLLNFFLARSRLRRHHRTGSARYRPHARGIPLAVVPQNFADAQEVKMTAGAILTGIGSTESRPIRKDGDTPSRRSGETLSSRSSPRFAQRPPQIGEARFFLR